MWKEEVIDLRITRFFESPARLLLSHLIVVILLAIIIGVGCAAYDLRLVFVMGFHGAFKTVLVNMLTVLPWWRSSARPWRISPRGGSRSPTSSTR